MKFEEALKALKEGAKIRQKEWEKEYYIYKGINYILDKNRQTIPIDLVVALESDWEIYQELTSLEDKYNYLLIVMKKIAHSICECDYKCSCLASYKEKWAQIALKEVGEA